MAQENVAKLVELIRSDEELQAKLKDAFEAYDGPKDDERAVFEATIAPIAAEAGLPCTYEECLGFASAERGLSDEELEAVAGGAGCYYVGATGDGFEAGFDGDHYGFGICFYGGVTMGIFS